MEKKIDLKIENKLIMEKRDMNVYHHSSGGAHLISHNSSINLSLKSPSTDDYLHISIVSGPGSMKNNSLVNLPVWADFEFSFNGNVTLKHSDNRLVIKLPPGHPDWQLKMSQSFSSPPDVISDFITIGDDQTAFQ